MILDKALEFLNKKEITSTAVTSDVVELGNNVSAPSCVIVLHGANLAGGTGLTVAVETADDEAMTDAKTVGTFPADLDAAPMLQVHIPYAVKRFARLKITPAGTFTSGTVSAHVAFGPQLGAN
uniref:Uncharacterized protein n=1 Tax=uncultured Elusimicrobia bacterium TaxID=699876 RepID=A0A650ELP9_9BACT|nr:hypothetical protein Elusimicrob1349_1100 [uncultured Elusimicrobia bacterium]